MPRAFRPLLQLRPPGTVGAGSVPRPVDHGRARPAGSLRGAGPPLGDPGEIDLRALHVATYLDDGISPPTDEVARVVAAAADAVAKVAAVVQHATPAGLGRTMELLWTSVFPGGDRGQGFEADLRAMGATDPSEELAEFLTQAGKSNSP
jgi:hypothetical protein